MVNKTTTVLLVSAALSLMTALPTANAEPPAGSNCMLFGYNPDAFVNICKTGPLPSPVALGEPNEFCIIGGFCPEFVTLDLDGDPNGWTVGIYVDVLCNQPTPVCGCSQVLQAPIYACTILQG